MSPLAVFALAVQACLFQYVMSQQCGCSSSIYNGYNLGGLSPSISVAPSVNLGANNYVGSSTLNSVSASNLGSYGLGNAALSSVSSGSCATYGGVGTGQVGVAGDVGASGNTVVVGSVPVLGAVEFSGVLPAAGSVSISGQCGCGCN